MSISSKSLRDICMEDLQALKETEARETEDLEFKKTLPCRNDRGEQFDPWIERGESIGNYARDKLIAEFIAFANSQGGTLILGMDETKDEPRRAKQLAPIRDCERLAKRILDAAEDIIEPRLPYIDAKAFPNGPEGAGCVVFRVGKSLYGPHRSSSDKEFYVRRGERTAKMTVREIQHLTLEMARTGDRIEELFAERLSAEKSQYRRLPHGGAQPSLIRLTAVPTIPQRIENITLRPELWWRGNSREVTLDGRKVERLYPLPEFENSPNVRLRGFESRLYADHGLLRLLRDDGLVESTLITAGERAESFQKDGSQQLYVGWVFGLAIGTLLQIDHLRKSLAWDHVEFGLEFSVRCREPMFFVDFFKDHYKIGNGSPLLPLTFPRYSVRNSADSMDATITALLRDLYNSSGREMKADCQVEW